MAVNTTMDNPEKIGLAISMKDNMMPKILSMVSVLQLVAPISFRSNENPSSCIDRNKSVKPAKNGKIVIDMAGYTTR